MVFQDPTASLDPRLTIADSISQLLPGARSRQDRADEVARALRAVPQTNPTQLHPGRTCLGHERRTP
jgi:ABC-type microcin C transport system duplicated ATPase subunit YejF